MRKDDEVIVVRGKYAGMRGRVVGTQAGPTFDKVGVALDHPVHRLLGPAILKANDVVPAGGPVRASGGRARGDARESADARAYRAFVREMMSKLGMGFHPDTSMDQYVHYKSGHPVFSRAEAARLQEKHDELYAKEGFDPYAIGVDELEGLMKWKDRLAKIAKKPNWRRAEEFYFKDGGTPEQFVRSQARTG